VKQDWETLIPLLVHIQANLDQDLGLAALSRKAGLSPFHLQRLFKAAIGETPKAYISRLRVERAAFRLLIHDSSVLDIALECGFQNHETFIRAFRRRFGKSPRGYRKWMRDHASPSNEPDTERLPDAAQAFEISSTKVIPLRPMHLAFRRHVGPYESVPESIFDELEEWAVRHRLPGPPVWLGIGHDAPVTTPPEQLRFDAALVVPGPFAPEGRIGYQLLPGGPFAVTTHAGSYDTLPAAYAAIFPRVMALPGHQFAGLPVVEIYHTAKVNVRYQLNHTDICLPVVPTGLSFGPGVVSRE
jgi:AraC family transcriptional regulator